VERTTAERPLRALRDQSPEYACSPLKNTLTIVKLKITAV
jgi:hypothetical protein